MSMGQTNTGLQEHGRREHPIIQRLADNDNRLIYVEEAWITVVETKRPTGEKKRERKRESCRAKEGHLTSQHIMIETEKQKRKVK